MNKKNIIYLAVVILIAAAAAFGYSYLKKTGKIGYYTKQYRADSVDLGKIQGTDFETAQKYKNKFIEYQDKLEAAARDYEQSGRSEEKKPDIDYFIEKARYAGYLGKSDWAIEILNGVFKYYGNSSAAWNNLAKIYEEKKDYNKANEYYQKTIDVLGEKNFWGQYYYIAKNYMLIGNKEKAREYYEKYRKAGGAADGEMEEYLK